jgi:hypothetical protein
MSEYRPTPDELRARTYGTHTCTALERELLNALLARERALQVFTEAKLQHGFLPSRQYERATAPARDAFEEQAARYAALLAQYLAAQQEVSG